MKRTKPFKDEDVPKYGDVTDIRISIGEPYGLFIEFDVVINGVGYTMNSNDSIKRLIEERPNLFK